MQVGWQGVEGDVKVEIPANDFVRSPENVGGWQGAGGVAGWRWGDMV